MNTLSPQPRLAYLDQLKVFLTVLVILHHTGQPYAQGGAWYFYQAGAPFPLLTAFFWVNASFFMGLYFFISAYFMPRSYERKGAWPFVRDRLLRLGLPWLIFVVTFNSVQMYIRYLGTGGDLPFLAYYWRFYIGHFELETGHLWFLLHLLIYGLIYAGWRTMSRRPRRESPRLAPPGDLALVLFTVGLTAVSLAVRIWFPMNVWVDLLGFVPTEVAHLPQYLSLVVLGVIAFRNDWLTRLPKAVGYRWLTIGVAATLLPALWFAGVPVLPADPPPLLLLVLESIFCTGLSVGLLTFFREKLNRPSAFFTALGADAFAAYLIHEQFVVPLQFAMGPVAWGALPKFLTVGAASVVLSFLGARLLRWIPGVRSIL
jgi:fucose 4-O-acetylase-like acetyltransferase